MTGIFNVRTFGAKGDGVTLDTDAIQQTIDTCASEGGGKVVFPAGRYLCGTVFLKNHVTIYLSEGCVLLGSKHIEHYGTGEPNPQMFGYDWESVLFAKDVHDIAVIGLGVINGQGNHFSVGAEAFSIDDQAKMPPMKVQIRPSLIYFKNCRNVRLENIRMENAAQFATLFESCEGLKFRDVRIDSRQNLNTDGFHLVACRNIHISGCDINCGDDAIVINRSCDNVLIHNCVISSRWAGIRVGPFSSGELRNILVSHCIIRHTYGCAVKIQMGQGGIMENLRFQNLLMEDVTGPIAIRLCYFPGWQSKSEGSSSPGIIRNVLFQDIYANVAEAPLPGPNESPEKEGEKRSCVSIDGNKDFPVENVTFRNVSITTTGGGLPEEARGENYPIIDNCYPEYFLAGTPPAYGMFARYVNGLELENVRIKAIHSDARPTLLFVNVEDYSIANLKGSMAGQSKKADLQLIDCIEEA